MFQTKKAFWVLLSLILYNIGMVILLLNGVTFHYFFPQQTENFGVKTSSKNLRNTKRVSSLKLFKEEKLTAGNGVKSVIFDPLQKYLYALNLESGSIFEYDRSTRKINRKLVFEHTKGKGYNYSTKKWYDTFQEKPVEPCFSHGGKFLWVSLHNAEGVVAWQVDRSMDLDTFPQKKAYIYDVVGNKKEAQLRFIKTGKTPKVLQATPDGKYLLVANWHSNQLTVIDIQSENPRQWKVVKQIETGAVPRGIAVSQDSKLAYIGHMGSSNLGVISLDRLKFLKKVEVGRTPRHLINDNDTLFISLSSPEKIIKLNTSDFKISKQVKTRDDPRTIAFSPDHSLIFNTCYADDVVQAFRKTDLKLLGTWSSKTKPVGLDVFQSENKVEVWVCNYVSATIKVFDFEIQYEKAEL